MSPRLTPGLARRAQRVAGHYAPAYVLVDEQYEALHFSGGTGRYLEPAAGAASLDLLNLVHGDLRADLRAALNRVRVDRAAARLGRRRIGTGADARWVDIVVEPLLDQDRNTRFVVLFCDGGRAEPGKASVSPTVNGELAHRVNELARTNSDLKNLLESTQIATVFLDNDLRIKSFTPSVAEIFHLIDADLGRPITHIAARIAYPELAEDVRKVLRTLGVVEREVAEIAGGARYLVRVLPYRSVDNYIAGAVITFSDFTDVVSAQAALRESEERYRLIVESATDYAIISMDAERAITAWNPGAAKIFGWAESEILGQKVDMLFTADDRAAGVPLNEVEIALREGRAGDDRWHRRKDGSLFWASGMLMPLRDQKGGFVKILHDRTAEREGAERQNLLMAELQHRVKNILAVVRSVSQRTLEKSADLAEFQAHFDGRLRALARTQSVLVRSASGRINLEELVRDELLSHAAHDGEQVAITGPAVALRDRQAEIFSLALHELATNAVKYGALSRPDGRVTVNWRVLNSSAGPRLTLDWRESGVAVMDANPSRYGFGRDLIERGLPYELDAATSLEFAPGGVRCTIELALDDLHADELGEGEVA